MATATMTHGTASQQASAACHLERRAEWKYSWTDGVRYVSMPSGRSGRVYRLRADGQGCECRWSQQTGRPCSHALALDLADLEDDLQEPVPTLKSYRQLYPPCAAGCGDLADIGSFCSNCASDREYAARRESQRQQVGSR